MAERSRQEKIESYGRAYATLTTALTEFPRQMWHFKAADDWSIHDIVVHIADSEANSYTRCRRFIAEPGSAVAGYDENLWARHLNYADQNADDALGLFKALRLASYNLIKGLPEATWSNTIQHSENGVMTMDDWLDVYERHIPDHVEQMQRICDAWREQNPR